MLQNQGYLMLLLHVTAFGSFSSSSRPGVHLYDVAYFSAVEAQIFSCMSLHCSMRCCTNKRKHVKMCYLTLQTD